MQHTIRLAIALNARLDDDAGKPLALWIMPVWIMALWLPAILIPLLATARREVRDWAWHCRATAMVFAYWLGLVPRWQAAEVWNA